MLLKCSVDYQAVVCEQTREIQVSRSKKLIGGSATECTAVTDAEGLGKARINMLSRALHLVAEADETVEISKRAVADGVFVSTLEAGLVKYIVCAEVETGDVMYRSKIEGDIESATPFPFIPVDPVVAVQSASVLGVGNAGREKRIEPSVNSAYACTFVTFVAVVG